ncbi:hypothetical protein Ndes2526B_g03498 [Nannochloris sp. 'desiccata']|nr:hypothetical protein KSW81_001198 [Chlorella desiccata (nom. nud.)]KAH7622664.1 putative tRNA-splicing endonuclease subunit Sen54 [Chlorella desiccata (nom. nud.)]
MVDAEKFSAAIFRRGQKQELFGDGDDNQGDLELELKLDELLDVWSLPRAGKDLAAAIWRPQHNTAEVVLQRGRLFNHIGFMWGKKLFLHPEEALYLVDRANLLLFEDTSASGKHLLSLQECQELMVANGVSMDMYLVYCKLMRAGYIVQRHPFTWVVKNSESPTQIWSFPPSSYNSKSNRLAQPAIPNSASSVVKVKERKLTEGEGVEEEERAAKRQRKGETSIATATEKRTSHKESRKSPWWGSTGSNTTADATTTTTIATTTTTSKNPWAGLIDQTTLPRCTVREPAVHRALALFPNMQPLHHLQPSEVVDLGIVNKDGVGMLHFDVFAANSQFSRKAPGVPLYSISVCEGGAPPSLLGNNAADQASNGIPVRYSGVEHGDISYFAIARAELHKIIT